MSEYARLAADEGLIPAADAERAMFHAARQHYEDQARIAELERQLESARSVAIDRDQRLARVATFLDPGDETDCGCDECIAWRIATGEDKP